MPATTTSREARTNAAAAPDNGRGGGNPRRGKNPKPGKKKQRPQKEMPERSRGGDERELTSSSSSSSSSSSAAAAVEESDRAPRSKPPSSSSSFPSRPRPLPCTDPPLVCPASDYECLLGDASDLVDANEARVELLDCARHGEVDACRAILDVWSSRRPGEGEEEEEEEEEEDDGGGDDGGGRRNGRRTTTSSSDGCVLLLGRRDGEGGDPSSSSSSRGGITPLHVACANGHADVVRLLLSRGATNDVANDSGNTPLHWAAAAGHHACVGLLLDHHDALLLHSSSSSSSSSSSTSSSSSSFDDDDVARGGGYRIDVLRRNAFGRSALTEGFASGDARTIERLLNHDSAEEERIIGGLGGSGGGAKGAGTADNDDVDVDDSGTGGGGVVVAPGEDVGRGEGRDGVVHEFDFSGGTNAAEHDVADNGRPSVLIRELPIAHADDPFGRSPIDDTTGLGIWCASLVMARWMASNSMIRRMSNASVIELGAGCGAPSLAAAVHGTPRSVTITDLNPDTIDNARHNIGLNRLDRCDDDDLTKRTSVTAASIDWGDESTYPTSSGKFDYVICSDCIYQGDIAHLLRKVVVGLLDPGRGTFLYVAPEGGRDGLEEFISGMKSGDEFECVREEIAPDRYRENPLRSGDEEDFFLHFHELASKVYILYEFRRC